MEQLTFLPSRPGSRRRGARGVSLILVLGSLVFLTALTVAFLAGVGTELKSSKVYAQGASVKLLAQSAANIVMAEIGEATGGQDASGKVLCWASQPGMIRTYDGLGAPAQYYKLYSDGKMISTAFDPAAASAALANWASQPAVYTDLNQPQTVGGETYYPIVDGNNLKTLGVNNTTALSYDANNDGVPDVAGFSVLGAPPGGPSANLVPMPAMWLYVLQDGSVVAPTNPSGTAATVSQASASNPIVGRIAFWTDDETAKINVNTASEGSYWDTPRFFSNFEQNNLAKFQPAQNEFQRYPGHPATVCLSTVFGGLLDAAAFPSPAPPENIYPITPRVVGGGSLGGTATAAAPLTLRGDRLYATLDELLFRPVFGGSAPPRALNDPLAKAISRKTLQTAKFFLTADSRAPDVNLFNQPRVCIWPVSSNTGASGGKAARSPFDQLIAFCATLNPNNADASKRYPYYFQRLDPNSPSTDLPASGTASGLGRNRMLLEYLRKLTGQGVPGFGASLAAKYAAVDGLPGSTVTGTERDQILTEIFDYVRATNLSDQSLASGASNPVATYTQPFVTVSTSPNLNAGIGQVVPIVDAASGTRGFGRFPTLQQAFLAFIPAADDGSGHVTQIQAGFFLQLFDPSMGFPWEKPWYTLRIDGLEACTWDIGSGPAAIFPNAAAAVIQTPYTGNWPFQPLAGGIVDWQRLVKSNPSYTGSPTPLLSGKVPAAPGATLATPITFAGAKVTITFLSAGASPVPLQTITVTLPGGTFPLPKLTTDLGLPWDESWGTRFSDANSNHPWLADNDVVRAFLANPGDMRLVAARQTIPAAMSPSLFAAHPHWNVSVGSFLSNMAHNLRTSSGAAFFGAFVTSGNGGGRLVPVAYDQWQISTAYTGNKLSTGLGNVSPCDSDVAAANGVFVKGTVPGDWDNGIGNLRDGPYINKADEGDDSTGAGVTPYYYLFNQTVVGGTFFSPNRMIPSAGMFGSLPTGVLENKPWQTLLFRPGPAGHPGLGTSASGAGDAGPPYSTLPDHLFLDLFTMPVVQPYAISEPLSTAGRINMNYQIVPYTYIERNTGLRAALKALDVISVPDADAAVYKVHNVNSPTPANAHVYRLPVNADATLKEFDARFAAKDLFRSASEICGIDLVPVDAGAPASPTRANMDAYWATHRLTGDNSRERPYADLYPLLTTKSNTYTVHFRVQTLQKARFGAAGAGVWQEGVDQVTGDYRGSETIERYVDPSGNVPDYANPADPNIGQPLGAFYKFRVVDAKQFMP